MSLNTIRRMATIDLFDMPTGTCRTAWGYILYILFEFQLFFIFSEQNMKIYSSPCLITNAMLSEVYFFILIQTGYF